MFNYFFIFLISSGIFSLYIQKSTIAQYPFDIAKINNIEIHGTVTDIELIKKNKLTLNLELKEINNHKLADVSSSLFVCNFWIDTLNSIEKIYSELKIGNEINNSHARVTNRLAQLLTPDVLTGCMPAHGIIHARPNESI